MEEQPIDSEDHMTALDNRGKVVKEILDTERTYVASLEIIQVGLSLLAARQMHKDARTGLQTHSK